MLSRLLVRLTAPLLIIGMALLILAGGIVWRVHTLRERLADKLSHSVKQSDAVAAVDEALEDLETHLHRYARSGDDTHLQAAREMHARTYQLLKRTRLLQISSGTDTLTVVEQDQTIVGEHLERLATPGLTPEQRQKAQTVLLEIMSKSLLQQVNQQQERQRELVTEAIREQRQMSRRLGATLAALGIVGALVGLLGGVVFVRRAYRSLVRLEVGVRSASGRMSEVVGPLDVRRGNFEDEVEHLTDHITHVVDRLHASERETLRAEQLAAVGQLAAGLAHELRNPLTAMKTLVQTARQSGEDGTLDARDTAILDEEITRLNEAIQEFLDYARPPVPEKHSLAINSVVDATLPLIRPRAEQQRVEIVTEIAADTPEIEGDPHQLRQVLLNLTLNALDAMPGGGTLAITTGTQPGPVGSAGSSAAVLTVRDTGGGIDPEMADRIFEPFVSTREAGSGLGLSISQRIVEDHGGSIIASNCDGGAEFRIVLPTPASA